MMGGNAVKTVLNTLALVFMLEIDNLVFAVGLDDRVREHVSEHGRMALSDQEQDRLRHEKRCFLLGVPAFTLLVAGSADPGAMEWATDLAHLGINFMGFVEHWVDRRDARRWLRMLRRKDAPPPNELLVFVVSLLCWGCKVLVGYVLLVPGLNLYTRLGAGV